MKKRMAIVGGGPSVLFLLRQLVKTKRNELHITVFERQQKPGMGMPYGIGGSSPEHVTNVSSNEIPELKISLVDWVKSQPQSCLSPYRIEPVSFSEYQVVPRLLFGNYLTDQFELYLQEACALNIAVSVRRETNVSRIRKTRQEDRFLLNTDHAEEEFDIVVIACGHYWPEGRKSGERVMFSSPYPPSKLKELKNQRIGLKGCSLTAVDALRTLARSNGQFVRDQNQVLQFQTNPDCSAFRIRMYSRHAILPGLRFHLEDSHLSRKQLQSHEIIQQHRESNGGFVSLDFIFEKNFKDQFREPDPDFYSRIKEWDLETFVASALASFSDQDPFAVFEAEYRLSVKSIKERKSEFWKKKLAILSVAMNYPAKYFSAEHMQRLQAVLMPLISVIIAFLPQSSAEEMLALHRSGRLSLQKAEENVYEQRDCDAFIDCTGQPHLWLKDFPFQDLVSAGIVSQAKLRFRTKSDTLDVPGLGITDQFRAIDRDGFSPLPLYIMAVPYIGGFNPYYSGLDFCEDAAKAIVEDLTTS